MVSRLHGIGHRLPREDGPHRQAPGHRLRDRQQVGLDTRLLMGKQGPCAAVAALDLVQDQGDPSCGSQVSKGPQELMLEHAHPALSLHGLGNHRGHCFGVERRLELVEIPLDD